MTDTAGLGFTGLGVLGNFYTQAGRTLRSPDATAAEKSWAGAQLSYLSRNPGWQNAAELGRNSEFLRWGGTSMVVVGGVLTAIGYYQAGDPWWKAGLKSVITTGASFVGSYVGGLVGGLAGAAVPGADVTGIPEVAGAVAGGAAGGYLGGVAGNWLANTLLGP